MATLSPVEQFEQVKATLKDGLKDIFPITTGDSSLELTSVDIEDTLAHDDFRSQRDALRRGKAWAVPVYGNLVLKRGGTPIHKDRVLMFRLPKLTERFGYIVGGNEFQVLNQFRLKSGVYHRRAPNGDALAEFNLANGDGLANGKTMKLRLDPERGIYYIDHQDSAIPAYPLLRSLGVSDETLQDAWGPELLETNRKTKGDKAFRALRRAVGGDIETNTPDSALFGKLLQKTRLLPETTKVTLGKPYTSVTPDLLVDASRRLLSISKNEDAGDDKTLLEFQSVHGAEDLLLGHLAKASRQVRFRLKNALDKKKTVKAAFPQGSFDQAITSFFTTSLVTQPEQTNPLDMLAGHMKTTIMGEQGGIRSTHAISEDAKLINASHLGFLDPIHSPEGEKAGVSLALPIGVDKRGTTLEASFWDPHKQQRVTLDPARALRSVIAFPDQYAWKGGKMLPLSDRIKATRNGELMYVRPEEVQHVIPSPRALFGVATNMIPFLQNNQGNRAMTAAKQQEQAVPLLHREPPLVQVQTDKDKTFEEVIGRQASRHAPVDGVVHEIKDDAVVVKDAAGNLHETQVYRNFALKGHTLYDSEIRVKPGDKVKKGDLLADTTFTRDGVLSLGTNLETAYMPFHGLNYEDGIVISESAARKLTSLHIKPWEVVKKDGRVFSKKGFLSQYPHIYSKEQVANIGEDGMIRVGARVREGDPIFLALDRPADRETRKAIHKLRRGGVDRYEDKSERWDSNAAGIVTEVAQTDDGMVVYLKTEEPARLGDKLVGRHGNKGVITRIVADSEMPYREGPDGTRKPVDILLNPLGIPGRINLGQVLETAAGKAARKRGSVFKVRNFQGGVDYLDTVKKELAAAGLRDREPLMDPKTGKPFEQEVLQGQQYILKLKHQSEKKLSARSGSGGEAHFYDINHAPTGGGPTGGMSMGELGLYSLLSHGARENLWEMYTYKSNRNLELWDALREGTPLPPPKVPFAFDKFLAHINGLRVNVKKEGNSLQLIPFTEAQIHQMSSGELTNPGDMVRAKDLRPLPGGLFDERLTGGPEGTRWTHFRLAEPMPNPLFEEAIKKLLGMNATQFNAHVRGDVEVNGKRGGEAIEELLKKIDVKKELAEQEKKLKSAKDSTKDVAYKRVKILRALNAAGLTPSVYMMRSVPVLPPVFRPYTVKENGTISAADINGLYKDLGAANEVLRDNLKAGLPGSFLAPQREELYDGLKAMTGLGGSLTRDYKGILHLISGKSPSGEGVSKRGFFQKSVMKRRQDFSGRSVITLEPRQGLDEVGLPEAMAWGLYQPFIERQLHQQGYPMLDAIDETKKRTPIARRALLAAMEQRPVLIKRDPALHKFNVLAFKPRLIAGNAMEVHPLVTGGFNADFDGDAMSVYLPITPGAVQEARQMLPSNNLFSPTTGAIMFSPNHETILGLYMLSKPGKKTEMRFRNQEEAETARRAGKIHPTDVIKVGDHDTTLGRLWIEKGLPTEMHETGKKAPEAMRVLDKKGLKAILLNAAKTHPDRYGEIANHLKDLGNSFVTSTGYSVGLSDFEVVDRPRRDRIIQEAEREADAIRRSGKSKADKNAAIVKAYLKADEQIDERNFSDLARNPTNIYRMVISGSRGENSQLKQIIATPAVVKDSKDRVIPYLVPRSYSEGLDVASYWTALSGARKGTIQKTQGVRDPGTLSKLIINSSENQLITEEDCGTHEGISLPVSDFDVADRFLSHAVKLGDVSLPAGTLVTPHILSAAVKAGAETLPVRSPMRCHAEHGICRKCMGLTEAGRPYSIGTNVGVIAGQAIGEPSTQLSLRVFHTGGLARGGSAANSMNLFKRLEHLLKMPRELPNQAPLALETGKVKGVRPAPQGGQYVTVEPAGKQPYERYVPADQKLLFPPGTTVQRGDALTDGVIDPKQLLPLKGVRAVQDYLTREIHGVMKEVAPLRRRNVEVVVKAVTGVSQVEDEGDHPNWVRGDIRPVSQIEAWNRKAVTEKKKPVTHAPALFGVDVLPNEMQEDWIAQLNFRNLSRSIAEAAREGWTSDIHSFHPIPAAAYAAEFGRKEKVTRNGQPWKGQY